MKFAAVGSNCIDFYENLDGGTPFPGGGPVNMAVYAAEMGAQSAYVGPVGQDAFGRLLRRAVAEKGVDVSRLAEDLAEIEKSADAWAWDYAKKKTAFLKDHPDLPHYFIGAGNQYGAAYSYAMCYWEEQMWIRTKSISCPEFFHGMQEIIVADTPVTLFLGEDEQRPLAERVARFLPKVCSNYTIIDTKELPMPGISPQYRGSLSHLMMHAVNNRVDAYMELFLRHPLSIRRYYRQFDY